MLGAERRLHLERVSSGRGGGLLEVARLRRGWLWGSRTQRRRRGARGPAEWAPPAYCRGPWCSHRHPLCPTSGPRARAAARTSRATVQGDSFPGSGKSNARMLLSWRPVPSTDVHGAPCVPQHDLRGRTPQGGRGKTKLTGPSPAGSSLSSSQTHSPAPFQEGRAGCAARCPPLAAPGASSSWLPPSTAMVSDVPACLVASLLSS